MAQAKNDALVGFAALATSLAGESAGLQLGIDLASAIANVAIGITNAIAQNPPPSPIGAISAVAVAAEEFAAFRDARAVPDPYRKDLWWQKKRTLRRRL